MTDTAERSLPSNELLNLIYNKIKNLDPDTQSIQFWLRELAVILICASDEVRAIGDMVEDVYCSSAVQDVLQVDADDYDDLYGEDDEPSNEQELE